MITAVLTNFSDETEQLVRITLKMKNGKLRGFSSKLESKMSKANYFIFSFDNRNRY
jgi:hypothetical protein